MPEQGEHRRSRDRRATRYHGGEGRGANGKPYTLCHVTPFIAAASRGITGGSGLPPRPPCHGDGDDGPVERDALVLDVLAPELVVPGRHFLSAVMDFGG